MVYGDPGRIAADNCAGLADLLDAGHQLLFGFQLLDNDFDDPVTLGQLVEVVFKIARRDQVTPIGAGQAGRPRLGHPVVECVDNPVSRTLVQLFRFAQVGGNHVQQHHRNADICQMGRNPATHRPRSDHPHFVDSKRHLVPFRKVKLLLCATGHAARYYRYGISAI